jgi:type I restriction enzyme S subunit
MDAVGELGGMDASQERSIADVYNGYTYFAEQDIVIAKITPCFENGKGAIAQGLKNGVGFGTTEFHVLRPLPGMSNRWLFYLTMSDAFRQIGGAEMLGAGGQKRVPEDFIKNLRTGIPALDEQEHIAAFLDWKTAQIDALIAKKQALIEKLKEKRLAVISHSVTKGLDPSVPMRDSGIRWLGGIPAHWGVSKIKFVAELASGHTPSRAVPEYWIDCTIPWVSLNDSRTLREKDQISETHYQISELGMANSSARLLPPDVVVLSRDATVGLCAITQVPMAVSQHFVAYICEPRLVPKYLLFVFKAMNQHLESLQTGSTIVTIGMPEVRGLSTPLPPVNEQNSVVIYLEKSVGQFDALIEKAQNAMSRLTEYRTALITAAVTGQIDVRHITIPTPA